MSPKRLSQSALKSIYINYKDAKIHVLTFGQGPASIIAFTGFADKATLYSKLSPALSDKYTCYVFDLPFHGKSEWHNSSFNQQDLFNLVEKLRTQEKIDDFSLMGYSFGGRICQHIFLQYPEVVTQLILIAPDGMREKYFGRADQMPAIVRWFSRKMLSKPEWVFAIMNQFEKWGWAPPYLNRFLKIHLSTPRRQDRLFGYWNSIRFFKLNKNQVREKIKSLELPVHLFFGSRDDVIPVKQALAFKEGLPTVRLHVVEADHRIVNEILCGLMKRLDI